MNLWLHTQFENKASAKTVNVALSNEFSRRKESLQYLDSVYSASPSGGAYSQTP
jgi:hypothetical protein